MKYSINLFLFATIMLAFIRCKSTQKTEARTNEWVQLFNGKDLNNWHVKIKGYPLGENIYNTFRVENGALQVNYDGYNEFDRRFGHIFYKNPYASYILKLQYRFIGSQVKGGEGWAQKNSGVMIHAQSPQSMNVNQDFPVSIEVQLLGGLTKGKERSTANLCTPGTYVLINDKLVTAHCTPSTSKTYYGNQWVDLEVLVLGDSLISHKVNGKTVISYAKPQIGGEHNTLKNKEGEPLTAGYIALQSESHPVEFKNIYLKVLAFAK